MSSNTSGIAILGAGLFAKQAHLPAIATLGSQVPNLKAVYSKSEKSAHDLAETAKSLLNLNDAPSVYHDGDTSTSLDALLSRSDISAVVIVLPITVQPDVILKALKAGKHVLSEKPVAADVAKGSALISTYLLEYKPKGLIWRVAENFEAEPGIRAAGQAIRDGKIGKVVFFSARFVNYIDKDSQWYKTPWRTVPDYQGGFLLDGGVHHAAALRVILPGQLTHLSSFASLTKDYLAPHDSINAIIKSSSFHGTFELTFAHPTSSGTSSIIIVTGTKGWLSLTNETNSSKEKVVRVTIHSITKEADELKPAEEKEEVIDEKGRGVEAELLSFFEAVKGSDDGLGNPKSALQDVVFIQAALNSGGNLIDLHQLVEGAELPAK